MCGLFPAAPLPPLTPLVPLNLLNGTGYPVRNDNVTNYAYVGKGDGKTPPEMYIAYRPGRLDSPDPIMAGETTIFKNIETGLWCRLAPFSPQATCRIQGMLCDQSSPSGATILTYTGTGLAFQGTPLVQQPVTGTLVLSSDPSCREPGGDKFTFPPAPLPPLTPLEPLNLLDREGYPVRNDNTTNFAYVGKGDGKTPSEQYIAYRPGNPSSRELINAGETTIFKNVLTGKWCRLAPFTPSTTCQTQGMLCDKDSTAEATVFMYTGNGLSYNRVPLVQQPVTGTLVLSSDPKCGNGFGNKLVFPPGEMWALSAQ